MRQIPLDRLLNALGKPRLRQPAKLPMDLRRIDDIATVMAFTILYIW